MVGGIKIYKETVEFLDQLKDRWTEFYFVFFRNGYETRYHVFIPDSEKGYSFWCRLNKDTFRSQNWPEECQKDRKIFNDYFVKNGFPYKGMVE